METIPSSLERYFISKGTFAQLFLRCIYYYIVKRKKKYIKLLESISFKQWLYTQWQSGDVWNYAPYLTKLERDMITYGNAQWSMLSEAGEDD